MQFIFGLIQFIIGLVVGTFVSSQIFLPVFYSLPFSIYGVLKRKLKPSILLTHVAGPIIWVLGVFVIYFISGLILPGVYNLISSDGFIGGSVYGLFWLVWGFFTKKGRQDMKDDYDLYIKRYVK